MHDRSRFYSDYIRCLACASGVDITRTRYFHLTQRRLSVDKPDAACQKIRRIQKTGSVIPNRLRESTSKQDAFSEISSPSGSNEQPAAPWIMPLQKHGSSDKQHMQQITRYPRQHFHGTDSNADPAHAIVEGTASNLYSLRHLSNALPAFYRLRPGAGRCPRKTGSAYRPEPGNVSKPEGRFREAQPMPPVRRLRFGLSTGGRHP